MEITYFGQSAFKIRGKKTTLVTDPFSPEMMGIKIPATVAEVVTVSHQHEDHNYLLAISGNPLIISGPGEYEVKGAKVLGIATYHDSAKGEKRGKNTVYRIEIDGISLVHLGDLGEKLNDKEVEILDGVDILMIPVGGIYTISAHEAVEVISQLEPKIIIPMHYNESALKTFLKEAGENPKPEAKLTLKRKDLEGKEGDVFVLDSSK